MEESVYSIGEISKLFNIPKSTIRYWEEKEVFLPRRNSENDYRLFNLQSGIELLDVIFYRNLNVPIQKMKHFNRLSPEEIYIILNDTEKEIFEEFTQLQKKIEGIANRKEQLENLFSLKESGYLEEELPIEKIVAVDMYDPEDLQIQLEFLSNFVLYKEDWSDDSFKVGISVAKNYNRDEKEIIWANNTTEEQLFLTCLLESNSEDLDDSNLKEHVAALEKEGYLVKQVIASYLATASENHQHSVDYYKAWLEVEKNN